MQSPQRVTRLILCVSLLAPLVAACSARDPVPATAAASSDVAHCLPDGGGFLHAQLRGAIEADLDWHDTDIQCEGGPRPDGKGLRVSIVGPLPPSAGDLAGRKLRFVFGIEAAAAVTEGHALATNVTAILESDSAAAQAQLFATRGVDNCTSDAVRRLPVAGTAADAKDFRVDARGFCVGPANSLDGQTRLHITTFDFAARVSLKSQ